MARIELALSAWEAGVLPLNYTRVVLCLTCRPSQGPTCARVLGSSSSTIKLHPQNRRLGNNLTIAGSWRRTTLIVSDSGERTEVISTHRKLRSQQPVVLVVAS